MSHAPASRPETNERLLLVDDDDRFRRALSRALGRRGMTVVEARSAGQGLARARRTPPARALVDLRLEGANGLRLVRALMGRLRPAPRIVVLTGYASVATAVEAIKLGAVQYLAKPAEPDDILAAFHDYGGDPQVPAGASPMSPRRLEWEHIQRVLRDHGGNVSAAARALGMHRRTLQRKLRKRPVRR